MRAPRHRSATTWTGGRTHNPPRLFITYQKNAASAPLSARGAHCDRDRGPPGPPSLQRARREVAARTPRRDGALRQCGDGSSSQAARPVRDACTSNVGVKGVSIEAMEARPVRNRCLLTVCRSLPFQMLPGGRSAHREQEGRGRPACDAAGVRHDCWLAHRVPPARESGAGPPGDAACKGARDRLRAEARAWGEDAGVPPLLGGAVASALGSLERAGGEPRRHGDGPLAGRRCRVRLSSEDARL